MDRKPAASPRFDSQECAFRAYCTHQARLEILSGRSSSKRAGNSFSGDHLSETFRVSGGINVLFDISGQKAVQESIRNARSLDVFQDAFSGRIAALSKTHSLLTDNAQQHVPLRQLLNNELEIHNDGEGQRISLSGPDVDLPAHFAVSYGMSIHELTTNAIKYGALSTLGGRLKVNWTSEGSSLNLRWEELNVPIAGPPTRVGFGTQLLRRLLPHQLGAKVDMAFEPDGLKAEISAEIA